MSGVPERLTAALADRYRIERELGAGGMATVYLAHDLRHDRQVAIKVLRPELAAVIGADRFLSEIKTTANLQHPHILPLFDSGVADSFLFYVMPLIAGESLRDRLNREKQLPIPDAVRIATEVAGALDYAHRHGVIHRDIKPENIQLHEGQALVADFGIALATTRAGASRMTETGMSLGTPSYMSPEQAMGESAIDGRADVFALGCVLYEMLLGEPPFTGATAQAIVAKVMSADAPSLTAQRRTIPPSIDRAVHQALERLPADRFSTAGQFAAALAASATTPLSPRARGPRRLLLPLLGLAGVLAIGAFLALRGRGHGDTADAAQTLRTIAVLPFRNISQDTAQQYFSAGMTEEIATQLSRVGALRVLGRAATAQYEGASDRLQRMAGELGVGSVVEGSVRLAGDQVRIGVELTDVRTGQTLWSEQYDRQMDDVFAVQGDVARKVSLALQATLTPTEAGRVGHVATSSSAAYQLYLRALNESPTLRTGNATQSALLHQAIQLDPNFADAYATLARTYLFRAAAGERPFLDSGFVAAQKAIALDSGLAAGYFALGDLESMRDSLSAARRSYLKTLELLPSHSGAMADLANVYVALGRYDEALDWALRAQQLNPKMAHSYYHVGLPLLQLADDSASARYLLGGDRALPGEMRIQGLLIWLDLRRGRNPAAMEWARRLVRDNPDNTEAPPIRAEVAVFIGDTEAGALIAPLALQDPEAAGQMFPESLRSMYALTLKRQGKAKEATTLWTEAAASAERGIAQGREGFGPPMELAAISAIRGDTGKALDWLERGYRAGFKDAVILSLDPFFQSLRQEARYRAVVTQMKQDVAGMRALAAKAHPGIFAP
jgi:eukaryotic-like serine/threonine-protein kinase